MPILIGNNNSQPIEPSNFWIGGADGKPCQVQNIYIGDSNGEPKLVWSNKIETEFTYFNTTGSVLNLQRTSNYKQNTFKLSGDLKDSSGKNLYYYTLEMKYYLSADDANLQIIPRLIRTSDEDSVTNAILSFYKYAPGSVRRGVYTHIWDITSPNWIGNDDIYLQIWYSTETSASTRIRFDDSTYGVTLTCYNYNPNEV